MTLVRTRDEAIALTDTALGAYAEQAQGILVQAKAAVCAAQDYADRVVRDCRSRAAALEALLSAASERDAPAIRLRLLQAQANLDRAGRASVRIGDAAKTVRDLERRYIQRTSATVAGARAYLHGRAAAIGEYHGSSGFGVSGRASTNDPSRGDDRPTSSLAAFGMASVDVMSADLTENPIQGEFGRGGATRADYRWAVQTWHDTIAPGLARGMSRSDFEADDALRGAQPLRRTADVYDMFLGDDHIRVDRRPDGTFNVISGRHRLQIARDLGIESLPGKIYE